MESEEDYSNYDTDDYSSIQSAPHHAAANGEAYMVTDVYHQPMPLAPTPQGSSGSNDSGPEYSTPFAHHQHHHHHHAHNHHHHHHPHNNNNNTNNGGSSPGSSRRVFSSPQPHPAPPPPPPPPPGSKQKPRMGVMAARGLSDTKNPKGGSEARTWSSDDTENSASLQPHQQQAETQGDDYDSPVYDSTQYIVTPTRRRNSENEKTANGRTLNRRGEVGSGGGGGGGVEYPEVRGRLGEAELPPGVVLLQPNLYQDGTLDSQMMSDMELANLRATMRLSPDPETVSGDSSTAHDLLLSSSGNHVLNGNGAHGYPNHHFHPPQHQHPHNTKLAPHHHHPHHNHNHNHHQNHHQVYDFGGGEPPNASRPSRPGSGFGSGGGGGGAVFRSRRRAPCWCVLLVLVALALLAAGISLGVLFGVMKAAESPELPHTAVHSHDHDNGGSSSSTSLPGRGGVGVPVGGRPDVGVLGGNRPDNTSRLWIDGGGPVVPAGGGGGVPPDWAGGSSGPTSIRTPSNPSGSVVVGAGVGVGGRKDAGGVVGGVGYGLAGGWGVSVRRFKAYWHPGDSRLMEVLLSNGTRLHATGFKSNRGAFRGLYSLTLTNSQGRTTRVWFMGGRSLGSVLLPDGTAVNLDWSANDADIECKIFQIPPPRGAPGGGPGGGSPDVLASRPTSHLATLQLGVHSYLLRQITRTLEEASEASSKVGDEDDPSETPQSTPHPIPKQFCTPRLPVKVTKCGGQYPYDGAFVQGEIALQTGPSLVVAALPWKRQDDEDECYKDLSASTPNFFIPLPGHIEQRAARVMAERFWRSSAVWWQKVCDVVGKMLVLEQKRHEVCANMAASAQTQLSQSDLYTVVYDSCSAVLHSLHLACGTLHELTTRAAAATAAAAAGGGGGSGSSGGGSGGSRAAGGGGGPGQQSLTHDLLHRVLANATSLQEPATVSEQDVHVKTHAFCPSTQPLTSQETYVTLQSLSPSSSSSAAVWSHGDITEADTVHVDCSGHPEVTYFFLGHAAAVAPLEKVKHRLKVCAVCAFDTTLSVHVQRDHMCCNDTCSRKSLCEDSSGSGGAAGLGFRESHTVRDEHDGGGVYCHEFLTGADTPSSALPHSCMGTCQSNLEVRFQVRDAAEEDGSNLPMDGGRVYFDQVLTCLEGYRSTCKSTFGH